MHQCDYKEIDGDEIEQRCKKTAEWVISSQYPLQHSCQEHVGKMLFFDLRHLVYPC